MIQGFPCRVADNLVSESRAIARYLVRKFGPNSTLIPPVSDIQASALFDAACSVEQANFDKPACTSPPAAASLVSNNVQPVAIVQERIFKP